MSYDRALTVFSPDGRLFQVEYALQAVQKGATAVALRGRDFIVMGVEKRNVAKLQDPRTIKKISLLDDHIVTCFAGLNADARALIDRARVNAQNHRLTVEDPISVKAMADFVSKTQQKYTISGGVRPFGVALLIAGFNVNKKPELYLSEPSGVSSAWKANAIGRNDKTVREYLEKKYTDTITQEQAVNLVTSALLEVVESGKNVEIAVLRYETPVTYLSEEEIDQCVAALQASSEEPQPIVT
ncbi:hypothetical protein RCL1_006035 [Eukaryota sp. TZLM3-RCL]